MPQLIQRILASDPEAPSRWVGLFLWQLDDQTRRLTEHTRGATPDELAWQSGPGQNTIGMLLAHVADVEVSWIDVGVNGKSWDASDGIVLPVTPAEIGIPLPADGKAPSALAGKDLDFFDRLLARARAFTRRSLAGAPDLDCDRRFRLPAPWADDTVFEANAGWVLYHVLEHQAGHYGQINLLRHQYAARHAAGSRT